MRRLAVLSMHTSPLAQPGTGDGGGMNVYVRELSAALARAGVECDVYTRATDRGRAEVVDVEPGLRVHHIVAGPTGSIAKSTLFRFVDEFAHGVEKSIASSGDVPDAIHANYWLSGLAGLELKKALARPLVSTFHTLDRVKAEMSPEELDPTDPDRRARAEAAVIDCSDAVLASCSVEVDQLVELYGADRSRVEVIAPGVDHAFFSPGDQLQARLALHLVGTGPLLLFVGRIQPLKGGDVAVLTLAELVRQGLDGARLVLVGGPSGPSGDTELEKLKEMVERLGLSHRVSFVPPQRHELLSTYYRAADCSIVPSMSESFGLVALEAAACGTPVVASAVGGLTSLVEPGVTGYLVEPRDVDGFSSGVARLWHERDHAREMGEKAALRARAYSWSGAAAKLLDLYGVLTERALVSNC